MQTRKILSFSLWGTDPKYVEGMRRNINLALFWYPGWEIVVCADADVPDLGPCVTRRPCGNPQTGLFWRIGECLAHDVSIGCVRDADSRIGEREREAVSEFEESGRALHVMRDHPAHGTAILGGMWGCRPRMINRFQVMSDMLEWQDEIRAAGPDRPRLPYEGRFGRWSDQPFLQRKIMDACAKSDIMIHDDAHGTPFKIPRVDEYDFVGQVYSATGERKYRL